MAEESSQSALTLEQAHLAVLRGQWGEARRLLEPLVAREPGNAAAQNLFAQVVAREARRQEEVDLALGTALPRLPPQTGSNIWTQPLPGHSPTARKWFSVARVLVPIVIVLALLIRNHWPDPKNERVATGLVNAAYHTATVSASDEEHDLFHWRATERRYGRVLSWRILRDRREFSGGSWVFTVAVVRERADTTEQVHATAGPSRVYGYYSAVNNLQVLSARPHPPTP